MLVVESAIFSPTVAAILMSEFNLFVLIQYTARIVIVSSTTGVIIKIKIFHPITLNFSLITPGKFPFDFEERRFSYKKSLHVLV